MRSYEAIMADIVRDAHNDAVRLEFAESIQAQHPQWARYVQLEVEAGARRRKVAHYGPQGDHEGMIAELRLRWEGQLRKYMVEPRIDYDRGLPTDVTLDAGMFVEYGSHILKIFPIRHVRFNRDEDGFDFCELFRCPHLASLESISLGDLTRKEREAMAVSPYLSNCAALTLGGMDFRVRETPRAFYDLLASGTWIRKLLTLDGCRLQYEGFPGERDEIVDEGRLDRHGHDFRAWTPLTEHGRELEATYGYIPWLHPSTVKAHRYDAAYHRLRGTLPPIAPGTPVPYKF